MSYTKIVITFNEDLPVGAHLRVPIGVYFNIGSNFVQLRSGSGEATVGVPTSIPGEITAIKYEEALLLDTIITLPYVVVRIANTITISFEQIVVNSDNSATNSVWNDYIGWVVPAGEVLTFYDVTFLAENVVEDDVDEISTDNLFLEFKNFNIDIIDTHTNDRLLLLEKTEVNSPKLIWQGSDDRFQYIMSSELTFNMLVETAEDGKFLHLFSGSETRYRVELNEVSDIGNEVLIWKGYLLPEQFIEPYENGCFFVQFTATDGIGKLKGQDLSDDFYFQNKNVTTIVAACLSLTGNELPLRIAPSFKNAIQNLNLSDISLKTSVFRKQKKGVVDKKNNAYDIMESILISFGFKLFQFKGFWYLIGVNRFSSSTILLQKHTTEGVYDGLVNVNRPRLLAVFESTPTISLLPKLKKITIDWQFDEIDTLTPNFAINQSFNRNNVYVNIEHWQIYGKVAATQIEPFVYSGIMVDRINTEHFYMILSNVDDEYGYGVQLSEYYNYTIPDYFNWAKIHNSPVDIFNVGIAGWVTDNTNKYIELIKPIFLKGDFSGRKTVEFQLEFNAYLATSFNDIEDVDPYRYELLLNDVVILSNDIGGGKIRYSFNKGWSTFQVKGEVSLKSLPIYEDGFLRLKFYAPMPTENAMYGKSLKLVFDNLVIKSNDVYKPFVKERDIDFTTKKDINVRYSDDRVSNTDSNFLISDSLNFTNVSVDLPVIEVNIEVISYDTHIVAYGGSGGGWSGRITSFEISQADYEYLNSVDPSLLFLKVAGNYVAITFDYGLTKSELNVFPMRFFFRTVQQGLNPTPFFSQEDELWVYKAASTELITDKQYLVDKWSRYFYDENIRFSDMLAKIHHDSLKEGNYRIDGSLFGLRTPLDIIIFDYLGEKEFVLTRLELNLTDGITKVFAIENKQENVTDYVD